MSKNVRLILRSDVSGIGTRGDLVEVSPGHARNFLVPRGLAFVATAGAEDQAKDMRRARTLKDSQDREAGQEIAKTLVPIKIQLSARAAETGHLFGSVGAGDVAEAVLAQANVELDRKSIHIEEPIKEVGEYQLQVSLHPDVQFPLSIEVNAAQ